MLSVSLCFARETILNFEKTEENVDKDTCVTSKRLTKRLKFVRFKDRVVMQILTLP